MSRVGSKPVSVPAGVEFKIENGVAIAKGKLGELSFKLTDLVKVDLKEGELVVEPVNSTKTARSMWGTTRARLQNLITGVTDGFEKKLLLLGTGYRAALKGKNLELQLGYSHDVVFPVPADVKIECPSQTEITITGADRQVVGQVAAKIREFRSPEPYKGKGVRYVDEFVLIKEKKK